MERVDIISKDEFIEFLKTCPILLSAFNHGDDLALRFVDYTFLLPQGLKYYGGHTPGIGNEQGFYEIASMQWRNN